MITTAAASDPEAFATNWSAHVPHVRRALAFVRRKRHVTAEELVEWDGRNGRRLFDWNNDSAADEWRRQQARTFLNRFRAQFEGMRVRAFIHVREDEQAEIERDAYFTVEAIAQHVGMREQVIGDITRRMASLASELAMWKLSDEEQADLFERLREAMKGEADQRERKIA
jgi:hypothetical protein